MVGILISIVPDMEGGVAAEVEDEEVCPLATQDESINDDLREKAVEEHNYREPNTSTAFRNDTSCGSCALYDTSDEMLDCIGDDSRELGYCRGLEFVCRAENVCDMWMEEYKDNL
jgi:hypothetical protein